MLKMMMKLTMGLGLMVLAAQQAYAQQRNCAPRQVVLDRLTSKYGETRQSIGVASNNALVEVFAAQDTGSWTITVTMPTGLTCLVASGQSYEALVEALPSSGDDA